MVQVLYLRKNAKRKNDAKKTAKGAPKASDFAKKTNKEKIMPGPLVGGAIVGAGIAARGIGKALLKNVVKKK